MAEVATDVVFQASDLGRGSGEGSSCVRQGTGGHCCRDARTGSLSPSVPLPSLEEVSEIGQAALTLLRAESGLRRVDAHESDLGPLAWLLVFDEDDRPVRGGAERCHHAG